MPCSLPQEITEILMRWFEANRRDLPWRQPRPKSRYRDPYRVWVAEVMLQQTQVDTVKPYYLAFMAHFPTVRHLAEADQNELLKVWEGLGYYARARNLQEAAKRIVEQHGSRLPDERKALLALPGIGQYTADAILSLAYRQDTPALEANGQRVLARMCATREPISRSSVQRELREAVQAILPARRAGDFNEALMDFGSLICTPRAPICPRCPLREQCGAVREEAVALIPARRPRRQVPHADVTAAVIWQESRVLITQRPNHKMLGGLWEFPGGKCEPEESLPACLIREIREELGLEIVVLEPLLRVGHAYSHLRITLHVFRCRLVAGTPQPLECQDWRWVTVNELSDYPLSVADLRVADFLRAGPTLFEEPRA